MAELSAVNAIHVAWLLGAIVIGLLIGWIIRGKRCSSEKVAINKGWQQQFEAQRTEHTRLADQNKSLMQQVSQLQASGKDAGNRTRELSEALKESLEHRDELQREIKDFRNKFDAALAQQDRIQANMDEPGSRGDAANLSVNEKDEKIAKLKREVDSWRERLPPLMERFRQRDQEANDLESELKLARQRIVDLKSRLGSEGTHVEPVDSEALTDGLIASNETIEESAISESAISESVIEESSMTESAISESTTSESAILESTIQSLDTDGSGKESAQPVEPDIDLSAFGELAAPDSDIEESVPELSSISETLIQRPDDSISNIEQSSGEHSALDETLIDQSRIDAFGMTEPGNDDPCIENSLIAESDIDQPGDAEPAPAESDIEQSSSEISAISEALSEGDADTTHDIESSNAERSESDESNIENPQITESEADQSSSEGSLTTESDTQDSILENSAFAESALNLSNDELSAITHTLLKGSVDLPTRTEKSSTEGAAVDEEPAAQSTTQPTIERSGSELSKFFETLLEDSADVGDSSTEHTAIEASPGDKTDKDDPGTAIESGIEPRLDDSDFESPLIAESEADRSRIEEPADAETDPEPSGEELSDLIETLLEEPAGAIPDVEQSSAEQNVIAPPPVDDRGIESAPAESGIEDSDKETAASGTDLTEIIEALLKDSADAASEAELLSTGPSAITEPLTDEPVGLVEPEDNSSRIEVPETGKTEEESAPSGSELSDLIESLLEESAAASSEVDSTVRSTDESTSLEAARTETTLEEPAHPESEIERSATPDFGVTLPDVERPLFKAPGDDESETGPDESPNTVDFGVTIPDIDRPNFESPLSGMEEPVSEETDITDATIGNGSSGEHPMMTPAPADRADDDLRDNLMMIRGVGPSIEKTLNELGIYRFNQIAEMSEYDIDRIAKKITGFDIRVYREDWIGQARALHEQKDSDPT